MKPFKCRVCRYVRYTWRAMAAHYTMSPGRRPIYVLRHQGQ